MWFVRFSPFYLSVEQINVLIKYVVTKQRKSTLFISLQTTQDFFIVRISVEYWEILLDHAMV